jgi:colanic acid biosynthesis glycosyl transferase WcaI
MKKICVVGLNYFPEISSTGLYTTEMCEYLSRKFKVKMVTGYPYYPEWKIRKDYSQKKGILKENIKNVEITRVKQYVPIKVNPMKRLIHYWDFYRKAFSVCKKEDYDMLMVILPNIFLLNLAIKLKKKYPNLKIWAHVQDFEIDAGLEMIKGINKIKPLKKSLYHMEKNLFSKFDIVSTISDGMMMKFDNKGASKDKQFLLPNWADIDFLYPILKSPYRNELKISDEEFVVMYSGNIGNKEDWDTLIQCIKKISCEKDIKFVIAGDGNKKAYVHNALKDCKNTILMPLQPKARLNDFLNLADLHVLPQKKNEINSFMPSKVLGIKATGRPLLCMANKRSYIYCEIFNNDLGYVLDENNYDSLSEKIKEIRHCELKTEKAKKARKYVIEHYQYENIMRNLKSKIDNIL